MPIFDGVEGILVGDKKVVGPQEANIAAIATNMAADAAHNELKTKINAILAALKAHGLIAPDA